MDKIASPEDLWIELRRILAYAGTKNPSRAKIASDLLGLADRVAARKPHLQYEKNQLKVLLDTLKMPSAMAGVMGGPSPAEAEKILKQDYDYTDAEIRKLKQASGPFRWVEKNDHLGHRWMLDAKGNTFDAFHITEIQGPGIPLYRLQAILTDGRTLKARRQLKDLGDTQKVAETWFKSDLRGDSLILVGDWVAT
jgi:hypothetical protein